MPGGSFARTYEGLKPVYRGVDGTTPIGFARTYEGLKHATAEGLWHEVESFARTYEGLKQDRRTVRAETRDGFARTYEGLKLGSRIQNSHLQRVLPVPMRD